MKFQTMKISLENAKFANFTEWLSDFGIELIIFSIILFFSLYARNPMDIPVAGKYFFCVFNKITGLSCPGCGMTRAFISIAHANFAEAFSLNALAYILAPFFVYRFIRALTATLFRKYLQITVPFFAIIAVVVLSLIYASGRIILEAGTRFGWF